MQPGLSARPFHLALFLLVTLLLWPVVRSQPLPIVAAQVDNNHHHHHSHPQQLHQLLQQQQQERQRGQQDPSLSARSIRDPSFLPAQVGGIVAAYGVSLVLVAITLLSLAKKRREHLEADEEPQYAFEQPYRKPPPHIIHDSVSKLSHVLTPTVVHIPGQQGAPYVSQSPVIPASVQIIVQPATAPGRDPIVDQTVVAADKAMAQQQLEDMYRHVMEHEEAKERGIILDTTPFVHPAASQIAQQQQQQQGSGATDRASGKFFRRIKNKPSSLELGAAKEDRSQSKASAMFSALLSPKKKPVRGISISSPILTPMSASFPQHHYESQEMNNIAPRHYAPVISPPPPHASSGLHLTTTNASNSSYTTTSNSPYSTVPGGGGGGGGGGSSSHNNYSNTNNNNYNTGTFNFGLSIARADTAPDISPASVQTIDERIGLALERRSHTSTVPPSDIDPGSAVSETSQLPLIARPGPGPGPGPGPIPLTLPSSPRLGGHFPSLPASPKPGATFRRPNPSSAVRANGTLPLRAYEEANGVPLTVEHTTKQTVFERRGPMSPGGGRTPLTANPVPYTPYQPYTPCIPVTPSLVTKEDRKRMRRTVPKTPTLAMVKSSDEIW